MDGPNGFGMWAGSSSSSSVNVSSSYGKKIQSALGNEVITIRIAGVDQTQFPSLHMSLEIGKDGVKLL
jgi:hypothetical protein